MFLHADNLICDHFLLVSLSAIDEKELCSLLRSEQCDRALMYVLIDNTTLIPFNGGKLGIFQYDLLHVASTGVCL